MKCITCGIRPATYAGKTMRDGKDIDVWDDCTVCLKAMHKKDKKVTWLFGSTLIIWIIGFYLFVKWIIW